MHIQHNVDLAPFTTFGIHAVAESFVEVSTIEELRKAIGAVKEGREITGESLVVLKTIFDDLSEGHDYIMRAVEMMAMLTGADGVMEEEAREKIGDFVDETNLSS